MESLKIDTLTQKRHLLKVMSDGEWHGSMDLVQTVGIAWNQRKNELRREEGIVVEKRSKGNAFEYRLLTLLEKIDLQRCELKDPSTRNAQMAFKIGSKVKGLNGEYVVEAKGLNGKLYVRGPRGLTIMKKETLKKIGASGEIK